MKWLFLLALVTLLSCSPSSPPEPNWGAEFVFKVLNRPSGDDAAEEMIERAAKVIKTRLVLLGFPYARVTALDADTLKIRVPGADPTNIRTAAFSFLRGGSLGIHEMAEASVQEAYNRSKRVPNGYRVFRNVASDKRQDLPEYRPWDADAVLIKAASIVDQGMISDAWPERTPGGTPGDAWHTAFVLSREGVKRLDEAARRLSQQRPPGLAAIVLDGEVTSTPRVTTQAMGREAMITGMATEVEARDLAKILLSGSLEVELGNVSKGPRARREPESLEYYGSPESRAPRLRKLR